MSAELGPKKLAAVMSVDIAGYSAMAEVDEGAALDLVAQVRAAIEAAASNHSGRVFNTAGDGFMLDFASAAGALAAAQEMCAAVECKGVRIGVHLCDVMVQPNGDLLGHGVNIAARLQQAATPGAVLVSIDVQRAVRGVLAKRLHAQGPVQLNKMDELIEVFVLGDAPAPGTPRKRARKVDPVLAVLPFDNESAETGMDHFSDGVADEIILTLMRYSELKVIGRTSAFQFRGDRKTSAAGALNATHVLDGAVRCAGATLRVSAQLIEAGTGVAMWSARYDRALVDAFEVQDDIAAEVGASLRKALQRTERAAIAIEPAAYDLYLRARQTWLTLSDTEEEQAETLLMRCIAIAPDFAPGWALLAAVRAFLLPRDHDVIGTPRHAAAVEAAQTALELDPECAQAFASLALLLPAWGGYAEKLRLADLALKGMPNDPSMHVGRAAWLYSVGRLREALSALEFASRLDPLGPAVESLRGSLLSAMGESEKAIAVVSAAWMRWPDSAFAWYVMWATLCAAGRVDEAEALAEPNAIPRRGVTPADVAILRSCGIL